MVELLRGAEVGHQQNMQAAVSNGLKESFRQMVELLLFLAGLAIVCIVCYFVGLWLLHLLFL